MILQCPVLQAAPLKLPYDPAEAPAALSAADPKLAKLIAALAPSPLASPGQQSPLKPSPNPSSTSNSTAKPPPPSTRASSPASNPCPRSPPVHPTPEQILDCPNPELRAAGLSANKTLALRDLAAKTLDGTVPTLARIRRMSDEAIIDHLTQVRGIGKWTVEMFLIFRLGRPDVFPTSDYGVRKGFALTFQGLKPTPRSPPTSSPNPTSWNAAPKMDTLALGRQLVPLARLRPRCPCA
jgi:DNA-3-methyladenine glycosylase II